MSGAFWKGPEPASHPAVGFKHQEGACSEPLWPPRGFPAHPVVSRLEQDTSRSAEPGTAVEDREGGRGASKTMLRALPEQRFQPHEGLGGLMSLPPSSGAANTGRGWRCPPGPGTPPRQGPVVDEEKRRGKHSGGVTCEESHGDAVRQCSSGSEPSLLGNSRNILH